VIKIIIKKVFYSLLIFWGVVTVVFLLFNVVPADPARLMMGQRSDVQSMKAIRKDLGLDKPVALQYIRYLNDLSPVSVYTLTPDTAYFYLEKTVRDDAVILFTFGNEKAFVLKYPYLRRSYQSGREVTEIIKEALPNTFVLALVSIFFATLLGIFLGILASVYKDTLFDRLALLFSALGMSLPSFFAAILVGWTFAFLLGEFTGLNLTGNLYEVDDFGEGITLELKNLILPAFTLAIRPLAIVIQLTRNSMLETMGLDYIRTARAKGLSQRRVIYRHALRNSLNPVVTAVSGWFASMMAGVVFVEYIFGWKGLGYVIVAALNNYDLPVVLGSVLTISVIFVLINILIDIIYAWLDPRVRR